MDQIKNNYLELCKTRARGLSEKMVTARNGRDYAANSRKMQETEELYKLLKKQKEFSREKLNHRERRILSDVTRGY